MIPYIVRLKYAVVKERDDYSYESCQFYSAHGFEPAVGERTDHLANAMSGTL